MLELIPVTLTPEYSKKWNVNKTMSDFMNIYKDGVKVSDTLYRLG